MELIASGRVSKVYALDERRVLRRGDTDATGEAVLMRYLRARGFCVPEVHDADGGDLVMQRLHGPLLSQALSDPRMWSMNADGLLSTLGDLLARLHRIDPPAGTRSAVHGVSVATEGVDSRMLHLDLHPRNVILTHDGPYVVDWSNAAAGDPALDIAMSCVILAGVAGSDPSTLIRPLRDATVDASLPRAIALRSHDPHVSQDEVDRALARLSP